MTGLWCSGSKPAGALTWSWGFDLKIVVKPEGQKGFSVLPRRWVVERTFAWLGKQRRLSKDYEELPSSSEALIQIVMSGLMVRRLAPA